MLKGWRSRLAEDAVQVGTADRADALGHLGALVVDLDLALRLALLLALDAVELTAPGLRHDGLLAFVSSWSSRRGCRRGSPPGNPGGCQRSADDPTPRVAHAHAPHALSVNPGDSTLSRISTLGACQRPLSTPCPTSLTCASSAPRTGSCCSFSTTPTCATR